MQKKLLRFIMTGFLAVFLGFGAASATTIDFEFPAAVFDSNPTISGVSFYGGDPLASPYPNDAFVDDTYSPSTNQYLAAGVDDGTLGPGLYNTFIGATASGFTFSSVTLDFASKGGALPGAVFMIDALSGGTSVASTSITLAAGDLAWHSLTVSFASGFDTLRIFDTAGLAGGVGDFFEIDNFDFTEWTDPGTGQDNPIPEPATMMLFGLGLLSIARFGRKE